MLKSDKNLHPPLPVNQPVFLSPCSELSIPNGQHFLILLWEWPGVQDCMEVRINPIFHHLKGNELSHDVLKLTLTSDSPFMWSVLDLRKEDLESTLPSAFARVL